MCVLSIKYGMSKMQHEKHVLKKPDNCHMAVPAVGHCAFVVPCCLEPSASCLQMHCCLEPSASCQLATFHLKELHTRQCEAPGANFAVKFTGQGKLPGMTFMFASAGC
jgi:hypothetical protein